MKNWKLENSLFFLVVAADSPAAAIAAFNSAFVGQLFDPPSFVETEDAETSADAIAAQIDAVNTPVPLGEFGGEVEHIPFTDGLAPDERDGV